MQYTLTAVSGTFDLDAIRARVLAEDPAATLDLDDCGATLRVATVLTPRELALIAGAELPDAPIRLVREHEGCCGGCGG